MKDALENVGMMGHRREVPFYIFRKEPFPLGNLG